MKQPISHKEKALFLAKKMLVEHVYNTVALEGSPYTFPEVQTLLEGITVGGHTLADQELVLRQAKSWEVLIGLVKNKIFTVSKDIACQLHTYVAKKEAPQWGIFRTDHVQISGTVWFPPAAKDLEHEWNKTRDQFNNEKDLYSAAIGLFLNMARCQFFWDGNKRTARLMMNGVLLSNGYEAISIPAKQRLTFNEKMIRFYDSGDKKEMIEFMLNLSGILN